LHAGFSQVGITAQTTKFTLNGTCCTLTLFSITSSTVVLESVQF